VIESRVRPAGLGVFAGEEVTTLQSFRDGPKDQTRNLEIPGSLRAPE